MTERIEVPARERLPWSEGLTIAIAPGLGYLLAFVYQLGFAVEMHIPVELVRVELGNVLLATIGLLASVLLFWAVPVEFASQWFRLPEHAAKQTITRLGVGVGVFVLPPCIIYRNHLDRVEYISTVVAIFLAIVLLTPVVYPRGVKGYWERARIWHQMGPAPRQPPMSARFEKKYGQKPIFIFLLIFLIYISAYAWGSASALDRKDYLTVAQTKEVVLNIYGENAVLAPFNGDTFSNTFRIVNLHDSPDIKWELRRIGPIRPDEVPP
jgi:hypothetical protein